jgi:murein DD-endopeptidase MepM/ murein hydrolase activator NlpD
MGKTQTKIPLSVTSKPPPITSPTISSKQLTTASSILTTQTPPTAIPTTNLPTLTITDTFSLCSPLEGIALNQIIDHISNPFSPPPQGSDEPHQGIDLSVVDPNTGFAVEGTSVKAVLTGYVAAIINDRFPYGNAIIIETPLDSVPSQWLREMALPTKAPIQVDHPVLTCPKTGNPGFIEKPTHNEPTSYSLFLLYAHLLGPVDYEIGEGIHCGSRVGSIGSSGNTLHPHLHLELRTGPSGYWFAGLAHYDTSATNLEMAGYCAWRVSGEFQVMNPLDLLIFSSNPGH